MKLVATINASKNKAISSIVSRLKRSIAKIGCIGHAPGDSEELKSHKTILTIGLYVATSNLLIFFPVYIGLGRLNAAITLIALACAFTINLVLFHRHRNFTIFRNTTFIGLYIYIIVYHTVMGGYIGSTGYINYGIAALAGILIFYKSNKLKNAWFILYVVTAIILYFLDPVISKGLVPLSNKLTTIMFVNNFILIAGMVMISANYFINIIQNEKLKSDILIRNILPATVVDELNRNGRSSPIMVPKATAIFLDFVGFTRISQKMEPQELVAILNEHFTKFDQIFRDHKVEKLKTIGDGYMAVGGLPDTNYSHPLDVGLAALQILHYMENRQDRTIDWNVRIGIHTGPMVAGIIGETKFAYDVWGASVNLCSRLESAGRPGFINVSLDFMEYTKAFFEFEYRGMIEAKNIEPTPMYFLTGIKPSLGINGFLPNSQFLELYKNYASTPITPSSTQVAI